MKQISLDGRWLCRGAELEFSMTAPGTVHTGLIENGLIADPFWRDNAEKLEWIGRTAWTMERRFTLTPAEAAQQAVLEFDGLDTFCVISLNGAEIGRTENMFLPYRFAVHLQAGENILSLAFSPPEEVVADRNFTGIDGAFTRPRLYVRRMQCTFGWDWVHSFVTMGIWKAARLWLGRAAAIDALSARTVLIDQAGAELELRMEAAQWNEAWKNVRLTVFKPDGAVLWSKKRRLAEQPHLERVSVAEPALWYPAGYGAQPFYTLRAELTDEAGDLIAEKEIRFGIRTVRVRQLCDQPGSRCEELAKELYGAFIGLPAGENEYMSFEPLVNGVAVLCRGADWVPPEPFPGSAASEKYMELIRLAKEGNCNMLRVWGGGIYEDNAFYDACDEAGLLIAQDFMMACGSYPAGDAEFRKLYQKECEAAVKRLMHHPCIVWWAGDNENQLGSDDDTVNAARRFAEIAGRTVRQLDGSRPFFISSPFGGGDFNSPASGMAHNTARLDYYLHYIRYEDCSDYVRHFGAPLARFAGETPVLGGVMRCSLEKFLAPEDLAGRELLDFHTKNHPAEEYRDVHLFDHLEILSEKLFGKPADVDGRLYRLGFAGYEWVRAVMESFRREPDFMRGSLFWMFNDCWPAIGWSMVDYYGVPKGSWYAMKRTAKPVTASILAEDGVSRVFVANDSRGIADGTGRLILAAGGKAEHAAEFSFRVPHNAAQAVFQWEGRLPAGGVLFCDIETCHGGDRARMHTGTPAGLNLPAAEISWRRDANSVTLTADKLAFGVQLCGEYVFEENYFDLLPGETKTICFREAWKHEKDTLNVTWLNQK